MYRIVREENHLTDKIQFFIEEYKGFIWRTWSRDLDITAIRGPIGASTLEGAKWKLNRIKSRNGKIIEREIVAY